MQKRPLEESSRGALLFVWQHFHVTGTGVVVVADVQHLVTRLAVLVVADACGAVTHFVEIRQLLRVQVEQVAWGVVLVTVGWLLLLEI
jgi:hypothetical protein